MSGKMCTGDQKNNAALLKDSRAYCEGRDAAAAGELITANPQPLGSEARAAWTAGWTSWNTDPATGPGQDCCSAKFGGGFVPV